MRASLMVFFAAALCGPLALAGNSVELQWGSEEGHVGYFNNTIEGFRDPFPWGPNAFVVGPDGRVIIADTANDSVLVVDRSGTLASRYGKKGEPALAMVRAVASYGKGELVAGLSRSRDIVRIDASGVVHPFYSSPRSGAGQIGQLQRLATDDRGRVYVGDVARNRILCLSPTGTLTRAIPWELSGFAVTSDGSLYLLQHREPGSVSVIVVKSGGRAQELFRLPLATDAQTSGSPETSNGISSPRLLGVDEKGNVFLRTVERGRKGRLTVRRISPDGATSVELGEIGANGAEDTFFVSADGKVSAMDFDAARAPAGALKIREMP